MKMSAVQSGVIDGTPAFVLLVFYWFFFFYYTQILVYWIQLCFKRLVKINGKHIIHQLYN